jgi:hypothetical protein
MLRNRGARMSQVPLHERRDRARDALHAEWTKLRTIPGTGWLVLDA